MPRMRPPAPMISPVFAPLSDSPFSSRSPPPARAQFQQQTFLPFAEAPLPLLEYSIVLLSLFPCFLFLFFPSQSEPKDPKPDTPLIMADPNPLARYTLLIYSSAEYHTLLADFQTTYDLTNANLYEMLRIVCDFTTTKWVIRHEIRWVIDPDEEAVECGIYFIGTKGICHF